MKALSEGSFDLDKSEVLCLIYEKKIYFQTHIFSDLDKK